MVPCQIPVNCVITIPNIMTLGTGGKWLYQREMNHAGSDAGEMFTLQSKSLADIPFHKVNSFMDIFSFLHLSERIYKCGSPHLERFIPPSYVFPHSSPWWTNRGWCTGVWVDRLSCLWLTIMWAHLRWAKSTGGVRLVGPEAGTG